MVQTENFEQVEIQSTEQLRSWLLKHYNSQKSVWLVTFKKSKPNKYVSRWDVLHELICFGWIDGIRRKLDEHRTMQLIAPRKVQHWAKSYKERAQNLIDQGRMHTSGFQSIKDSKMSGLWDFMNDVDNLIIPEDLYQALGEKGDALEFFENINDSSKRFVLRWIKLAKTEKTRSKRIEQLVELSAKGEKLPGS